MNKQSKFRARKGATFIEYALLAGLVAIVVAAAAMFFGDDLKKLFDNDPTYKEAVEICETKHQKDSIMEYAVTQRTAQFGVGRLGVVVSIAVG